MKGRGVVFTKKGIVRYQDVEVPEPGDEDIVIEVEHSWISIGTESSFLKGERITGEQPYREGDTLPFPQINGYQKVGIVTHIGSAVADIAVGERVFATTSRVNGMAFASGGHVSPAVTHASQVWKLPGRGGDGVDAGLAYAGMVLTQVGYNCGIRPQVAPGDAAVVIGDGLVGQWAAQTLLHRGVRVAVLGRHDERLSRLPAGVERINAKTVGAPGERLHESMTNGGRGGGIAVVIDTVGSIPTFYELLPLLQHNSHLVSAGFLGSAGLIDIQTLREKEITLHCPSGWDRPRMDETLCGIAEGWLQTTPLITHRYPIAEAEEAWRVILDPTQPCLGVILDWMV
ncbi:hypothetical protein ACFPYJ_19320 [Paenibacillus solisilvae]|uniref:Alcohol dehydrogenase-like C-terminal domain-containing protein n=1 Tax=Paenibacillus solisilvae TaxID=2486751 RepID=A0ABW0VZV4_9BACL